jgi:hypothetical protein
MLCFYGDMDNMTRIVRQSGIGMVRCQVMSDPQDNRDVACRLRFHLVSRDPSVHPKFENSSHQGCVVAAFKFLTGRIRLHSTGKAKVESGACGEEVWSGKGGREVGGKTTHVLAVVSLDYRLTGDC